MAKETLIFDRLAALEKSVSQGNDPADKTNKGKQRCEENDSVDASEKDNWPGLPTEIRMVVLGKTGAGKSSFGNTVLGTDSFLNIFSYMSGTTFTETSTCQRFGKKLVVCDTPGLFDTRFDNDIIRQELSWSMVLSEPGINVFLIVVRCDVRFSQEECDVIERIENHFEIDFYKYAIVIFTHKDQLEFGGDTEEGLLKNMPTRFQELLRMVNNKYIFVNNRLPYHLNEQVVRKLLDYICKIYDLNEPNIYKNSHLVKRALKERLERDLD